MALRRLASAIVLALTCPAICSSIPVIPMPGVNHSESTSPATPRGLGYLRANSVHYASCIDFDQAEVGSADACGCMVGHCAQAPNYGPAQTHQPPGVVRSGVVGARDVLHALTKYASRWDDDTNPVDTEQVQDTKCVRIETTWTCTLTV
jgi:hypothetical protein